MRKNFIDDKEKMSKENLKCLRQNKLSDDVGLFFFVFIALFFLSWVFILPMLIYWGVGL